MRKRLLIGFLCMTLAVANIVPAGITVWASEPEVQTTAAKDEDSAVNDKAEGTALPEEEGTAGETGSDADMPEDKESEESKESGEDDTDADQDDNTEEPGNDGTDEDAGEEPPEEPGTEDGTETGTESGTEDGTEGETETGTEAEEPVEEEQINEEAETLESELEKKVVSDAAADQKSAVNSLEFSENDRAHGSIGNIKWVLDTDGKLTVEGDGEYVGGWNDYREEIVSAEIKVSGAKRALNLFSGCRNLKSVDLSEFDTSQITDMSEMFRGCSSLRSLDVGNFDTSQVTNMSEMFGGCSSLRSLDVSNFDTSRVTDMGGMFGGCENLTSLDVSHFSTSQVTDMSEMFWECSSLPSVDVSHFDTSRVTDMSEMFYDCNSLRSIDVSNFDTSQVTNMGGMFEYCSSLPSLNVSGFDTRQVTNIIGMFQNCESLTSLDLGYFDTSRITYMGSMFSGCSSLTSLDVSHFDTSQVTVMTWMFNGCSSLRSLDLSNFDTSQVTNMYGMFEYCSGLTSLNVSHFDTSQVTNMFGMFDGCSSLTELDLSSFDTSNVTDMCEMFQDCSSLRSLDLSNFDTSQVTAMFWMFNGCSSLRSLDVSHFDTSQVTVMFEMFYNCRSLTELDLSSFNVNQAEFTRKIGGEKKERMFGNCISLSTIYTPYNITHSVTLPKAKSTDVWYMSDGTKITKFPKDLDYSILITKNKKLKISDPFITAKKDKTAYKCGEEVNTDDITVTYHDSNGRATKITEGYSTNVSEIDMSVPGAKKLEVTYQGLTAAVELTVTYVLKEEAVTVTLPETDYIYSGAAKKPVPVVEIKGTDAAARILTAGTDYTVSYENNVNAGDTAKVVITGINDYSGILKKDFTIGKAGLEIRALETVLAVGDALPNTADFNYQVTGLMNGDKLITKPSFTCDVTDMSTTGTYVVTPHDADAGANYSISYAAGTLVVAQERVVYTVSFDMQGHGDALTPVTGIRAGSFMEEPEAPQADGYIFSGWYKDKGCTKKWNFTADAVQNNITLYACWLTGTAGSEDGDYDLRLQEIREQTYTGSPLKPAVQVYASDGSTLLKAGKDYTVKYFNNTAADTEEERALGGTGASDTDTAEGFTKKLAYVVITGKGNYKGTIYRNFHIAPAAIGDGSGNPAAGITLKYTEQLVSGSKAQKPFGSLKYKKSLKAGRDFTIQITALASRDKEGNVLDKGAVVGEGNAPAIPAGYRGTFRMKIEGTGNYSGTIEKTIHVSDKNHLMKNASVALGKNLKNIPYTGEEIVLTPAYYDASDKKYYAVRDGAVDTGTVLGSRDVYTVKFGKKYLVYGEDYTVSYTNNLAAGTATMTLTGTGDYTGSKRVTFRITGTAFTTKNIRIEADSFRTSMAYTGKSLTQNKVKLTTKNGTALSYGRHYTISYKNNLKKGTATMTFTAKPASGYSGSFKKTFKIAAAALTDAAVGEPEEGATIRLSAAADGDSIIKGDAAGTCTLNSTVLYTREGAKPLDKIKLTNTVTGRELKAGTDYTVSYANNTAVTTPATAAKKLPVMKIKGKGNYAGTLNITYSISEASMEAMQQSGRLKVTASAVSFNPKKANTYRYQPRIKVTDGKKTLSAKKDYKVVYQNCTQKDIKAYLEAMKGAPTDATQGESQNDSLESLKPYAEITAVNGRGYHTATPIKVELAVYQTKLTTNNLYVIVSKEASQTTYTGSRVKPEVTVYYGASKAVKAAKKAKVTDETVLTDQTGRYKLMKLDLKTGKTGNYILTYGSNVTAGKNKGSVTVTGIGLFGGSVTTKFTILSRDIYGSR